MNKQFLQESAFLKPLINNDIDVESIIEIRIIKVLMLDKLNKVIKKIPYILLFLSNDLVGFKNKKKDSHVVFYTVKTKFDKSFLIGISIEYLIDGTKIEERVYFNKLSSFY